MNPFSIRVIDVRSFQILSCFFGKFSSKDYMSQCITCGFFS